MNVQRKEDRDWKCICGARFGDHTIVGTYHKNRCDEYEPSGFFIYMMLRPGETFKLLEQGLSSEDIYSGMFPEFLRERYRLRKHILELGKTMGKVCGKIIAGKK